MTQALPLAGIRVVDYSHFLAGPYVGRCLAAMGAEVIKVERPSAGDAGRQSPYLVNGHSGYFMQQNMGKQGLCVNMKDPRGAELMRRLTDGADVFVENYRPGALAKLGLGYAELAARNPGLVYASISAYGQEGPRSSEGGFDLTIQAMSGIMSVTGEPEGAPVKCGVPLSDFCAGLYGAYSVASVLTRVRAGGPGEHQCGLDGEDQRAADAPERLEGCADRRGDADA